ncbi:MAG: hypothetical protein ACE5EF_04645 [Dehalococcoidia bacterium]
MKRAVFLALTLAGAVAAACGGSSEEDAFPTSADPSGPLPTGQVRTINAIIAGSEWLVGHNNFVVGITDENDQPQGGAIVEATFFDLQDPSNPQPVATVAGVESAPGVGEEVTHVHEGGETHIHGGEDEDRVGYYFPVDFSHPGQWGVAVRAELKDGSQGESRVSFFVSDRAGVVIPGEPAPLSDNLTAAEVTDIREIDSGDPPNDMHDVKIKDAIEAGRPLVVVFATPAYCTSRFCGPVVEEMETLQDEFGEDVDFVHVEIWRSFERQVLNDTVKEWILRPDGGLSEPQVYVVDAGGTVYDRWEGPAAANILRGAVAAVASGALYQAP